MTRVRVVALLSLVVAAGRCGSPAPKTRPIASVVIGQSGGKLAAANGQLTLQVPPGALASSVALTIVEIDAPAAGAVGTVYDIGPTGTTFQQPATLTFHYKASELGGSPPESLKVATFAHGSWQAVPSSVNTNTSLVAAQIAHLSPWSLVMAVDAPPDGGVTGVGGGSGGGDGGSGVGGAGGADAGDMDGGTMADAMGVDRAGGSGGSGGTGGRDAGVGGAGGSGGTAGGGGTAGAGGSGGIAGSGGTGGTAGAGGMAGGAGGGGGGGGAGGATGGICQQDAPCAAGDTCTATGAPGYSCTCPNGTYDCAADDAGAGGASGSDAGAPDDGPAVDDAAVADPDAGPAT